MVVAEGLGADFGAKSPIVSTPDSLLMRTPVGVGSTDTVSIDISSLLVVWQAFPDQVRSLVVHLELEGVSPAQLRLASTRMAGMEPAIRVTYVPPFRFGR